MQGRRFLSILPLIFSFHASADCTAYLREQAVVQKVPKALRCIFIDDRERCQEILNDVQLLEDANQVSDKHIRYLSKDELDAFTRILTYYNDVLIANYAASPLLITDIIPALNEVYEYGEYSGFCKMLVESRKTLLDTLFESGKLDTYTNNYGHSVRQLKHALNRREHGNKDVLKEYKLREDRLKTI